MTPDMWKHFCDHVLGVEDNFWEKDGLLEDAVEEFFFLLKSVTVRVNPMMLPAI